MDKSTTINDTLLASKHEPNYLPVFNTIYISTHMHNDQPTISSTVTTHMTGGITCMIFDFTFLYAVANDDNRQ